MWPLAWSILNFPPHLRDKIHLGMHLASFDTGSEAALILFARELKDLWDHPIVCKRTNVRYRLFLLQILADGPGLCKITKTTGCAGYHGCNICDFGAERFAGGMYMPAYRRYLDDGHPMRRNTAASTRGLHFNTQERNPMPVLRTYDSYIASGKVAEVERLAILSSANGTVASRIKAANKCVDDGVHGVWAFDILPYSAKIIWEKDSMHAFYNAINDSLKALSESTKKQTNRTEKASVREECK